MRILYLNSSYMWSKEIIRGDNSGKFQVCKLDSIIMFQSSENGKVIFEDINICAIQICLPSPNPQSCFEFLKE